jgi:hypothetical protein
LGNADNGISATQTAKSIKFAVMQNPTIRAVLTFMIKTSKGLTVLAILTSRQR